MQLQMQHIDSAELRTVSRQIDSAHQGWRVWSWAALSDGQNWCVPSAGRLIRPLASSEVEMITVSSLRRSTALLFPPWNLIDWINLLRCCYRTTWNVWQSIDVHLGWKSALVIGQYHMIPMVITVSMVSLQCTHGISVKMMREHWSLVQGVCRGLLHKTKKGKALEA